MRCSPVLMLALGMLAAQPDVEKELEPLQGVWKIVAFETANADTAKDIKDKGTLIFEGNKLIVMIDEVKFGEAEFKLDPTKKPKHIDVTPSEGFNKAKTLLGIYELDGDKLKLFSHDDEKVRPKTFKYEKGQTGALITLERAKKKGVGPKPQGESRGGLPPRLEDSPRGLRRP